MSIQYDIANVIDRDPGAMEDNPAVTGLDDAAKIDDAVTSLACWPGGSGSPLDGIEYVWGLGLNKDFGVFTDVTPADLDWKYEAKMLTPRKCAGVDDARYSFFCIRSLSGAASKSLHIGHAARFTEGFLFDSGRLHTQNNVLARWSGGTFVPQEKHGCKIKINHRTGDYKTTSWTSALSDIEKNGRKMRLIMGLAFTQQLMWGVMLGVKGRRLRLSSSPAGIREFFALRDKGASGRRAALRHWVRAHWRRKPSDIENAEAKAFVRRHLRGALCFGWNGLECEIVVSPSDLKEIMQ